MSFNTSVHIQFLLNLTLNVVFKVRGLREITGHSGSAQFLHILNQHTFAYVLNPLHHVHSFIETLYLHREKLKKQNDVHSSIREASRNWPSLDELQTRKLVWVKAFFNFILMIIYTLFQTVNSCACVFFCVRFLSYWNCAVCQTWTRDTKVWRCVQSLQKAPIWENFLACYSLLTTQFTLSNPWICVILFVFFNLCDEFCTVVSSAGGKNDK